MPTATAFVYPKLLSPGAHCIEDKTTAQLDALTLSRIEKSDLSDIMAFWWNLDTASIAVQVTGYSTETYTSNRVTDQYDGSTPRVELTPRERVCNTFFDSGSPYTGFVFWKNFDPHTGDGASPLMFSFQRVYFNTTTNKYALGFLLLWNTPSGNVLATSGYGDANGTPNTDNGANVTVFGSLVPTKRKSTMPDVGINVDSPGYYTY